MLKFQTNFGTFSYSSFQFVPAAPEVCRWTDWTSCDFYCGTSPVSERTKELVSVGSDRHCRGENDQLSAHRVEPCSNTTQCKCGSSIILISIHTFLPAPFAFSNWRNTPFCNETCGDNRFKIQLRTCSLIIPNPNPQSEKLSCQNQELLRTGEEKCPASPIKCLGTY